MTDNYANTPASPPNSASDVLPDEISNNIDMIAIRILYKTEFDPDHPTFACFPRYNVLVAEGKLPITNILVKNKGYLYLMSRIFRIWNKNKIPVGEKMLIMTTFEYITYRIIFDKTINKNKTLVLDLLVKLFGPTYTDELYSKYLKFYKFDDSVVGKWRKYFERYNDKGFFIGFGNFPELEKKDREQRTMADLCVFPEGNIVGSN